MEDDTTWVIRFEVKDKDGKFFARPSRTVHLSDECVALAGIPRNIFHASAFFGLSEQMGRAPGYSINYYARQLAENLVNQPYFRQPNWLEWVADRVQRDYLVGRLDLAPVEEYFSTVPRGYETTQTSFALAYLFWKGIYYYLRGGEQWRSDNAAFLYLLSAWQAFMQVRLLTEMWVCRGELVENENAIAPQVLRWLNDELIDLLRSLDAIVKNPEFRYPIESLVFQIGASQDMPGTATPEEQILYAMALIKNEPIDHQDRWEKEEPSQPIAGSLPIYEHSGRTSSPDIQERTIDFGKPFCPQVPTKQIQWNQVRLHPIFQSRQMGLRSFIRKFVASWLLPRYDFFGAFHLARLLGERGSGRSTSADGEFIRFPGILLGFVLAIMVIFGQVPAIAAAVTGGIKVAPENCSNHWFCVNYTSAAAWAPIFWNPLFVFLESITIFALFILVARQATFPRLDRQVLPYLLLPRLMGGIIVGYAAIVLQGDSIRLKNVLFEGNVFLGWIFVVLLFLAVWKVSGWYFYQEATARVKVEEIARRRSRALNKIAFLASFLIGLVASGFTTAMEWETCQTAILYACPTQGPFIIGPSGVIDLRQMVVFTSLAMLTGLISQFLFEEKAITASVWDE